MSTAFTPDSADVEKNKVMAIISYIFILWLVPLFQAKDSKFALYHANQGAILTAASIVLWVPLFILSWIPGINVIVGLALFPIYGLAILAMMVIGILGAVNGKAAPLPVIGSMFTIIKMDGSFASAADMKANVEAAKSAVGAGDADAKKEEAPKTGDHPAEEAPKTEDKPADGEQKA